MAEGAPKEKEQNPVENKEVIPLRDYVLPSQEALEKANKFIDEYILPPLAPEQEGELKEHFEGKEKREKKVAKRVGGVPAASWGWAAGGVIASVPLTTMRALEYALLGWELDSNGWPKIDKQSMAHVDKWHNKVAGIKG